MGNVLPNWLAALPLAAITVAGCVSPPADVAEQSLPQIASPLPFDLDCAISTGWTDPCTARASRSAGGKTEIWVGVNPTDPANVVLAAKDLNPESSPGCVWNGLFVTTDAGRTWTDVVIGGPFDERDPTSPYFGFACNTDPMFAFGADGSLYYLVEMYGFGGAVYGETYEDLYNRNDVVRAFVNEPGNRLILAKSTDGGLTWPQAAHADLGDGTTFLHDFSRMRVNPKTGSVHTMINTFSAAGAIGNVLTSRDEGATVAPGVKVTPLSKPGCCFSADLGVSPEGTVVLLQTSSTSPLDPPEDGLFFLSRSTDDAASFTDPEPAFEYESIPATLAGSRFRTGTFPTLAYDLSDGPNRGRLYLAWADGRNGNGDILLSRSEDDGRSWSEPVRVSEDARTHDQFHANVVVDDRGGVHVAYFDRQYDSGNRLLDVTHAFSDDGGQTWTNRRVTDSSFDGDLGMHQYGFPFIGDYVGIGAAGEHVWIGYPDTRTGESVAAAAHLVRAPT